jgi:hypothetical protein
VIDIGRFHHKPLLLLRRRVAAGKVLQHAAELARAQFAVFSEVVLLDDLFELILLLNLRPELLLPFRLLAPPICNLSPPPSPPSTWSAHTLLLSTLSGEAKSVKNDHFALHRARRAGEGRASAHRTQALAEGYLHTRGIVATAPVPRVTDRYDCCRHLQAVFDARLWGEGRMRSYFWSYFTERFGAGLKENRRIPTFEHYILGTWGHHRRTRLLRARAAGP